MSETTDNGLVGNEWAGDQGRIWLANLAKFEGMIAQVGTALVKHAAFRPGENVLDLGCGAGPTTTGIARSVSPTGCVTGLDISQELIDYAGVRAAQGTQSRIYWVCADAATTIPATAPYDRIFSRFGSMFFEDAYAGFRNLRKMMKPGGRMDLAVWASPQDNAWTRLIAGVAAKHLPDLPRPDPRAPGPFAFGDPAYLTDVLEKAGFGRISFEPLAAELAIGGVGATPEEAADFIISSTHMGRMLKEAGPDAVADLGSAFADNYVPGKGTMVAAKIWIVTAFATS